MRNERLLAPTAHLEDLVPGINTEGLTEIVPGRVVSKNTSHIYETHSIASPMLRHFVSSTLRDDTPRSIELRKELKIFFKDKVVVDLGAGYSDAPGYEVAELCEAAGYIGVEPYHHEHLRGDFDYIEATIPYVIVGEDMRKFLPRLKDNSVSIIAGGIDGCILYGVKREDMDALNQQLSRTLHPDGALLNYGSIIYGDGLNAYPTTYQLTSLYSGDFNLLVKQAVTGAKSESGRYFETRPRYQTTVRDSD